MDLGSEGALYLLAFDHRGSFRERFLGLRGEPSADDAARIADAKRVIFEGFLAALEAGADRSTAGILIDEGSGSAIAREARAAGLILAMPAERSGQDEFDFEYGTGFGAHVEEFDPTFCKVLVRFNPEGDGARNARQAERLKELSDWLHHRDRKLLFELLIPAEPHQLETAGGDAARFDAELRPALMRVAIAELQEAGVEPDVWKIEGLDRREDCEAVVAQCRTAGRDRVACVVLGRGADAAAVDRWLSAAAGVPGYAGFAIGRSIWWDPLKAFVDGDSERGATAGSIAANYLRFIDVYARG